MNEIIVVFRRDRTGGCFALFPELPADDRGFLCTAYERVGQHCAADYDLCVSRSDPALPADYRDLYEELERRGHRLCVRRRATPDMHERRRRIAAERRLKGQSRRARRERIDRNRIARSVKLYMDNHRGTIRHEGHRQGRKADRKEASLPFDMMQPKPSDEIEPRVSMKGKNHKGGNRA